MTINMLHQRLHTCCIPTGIIRAFCHIIAAAIFAQGLGAEENDRLPAQQNERSLAVIRTALDWGCPFILYWQLYNNELDADGTQRGFWMIDDRGERQPIYTAHLRYYEWARQHTRDMRDRTKRPPTDAEFLQAARNFFKQSEVIPSK